MAFDGGNFKSESLTVNFVFVDKSSEPYFVNNTWRTKFTENQTGLEESILVPEAFDPKNFGIQYGDLEFKVYYYLDCKIFKSFKFFNPFFKKKNP